jgi:hypothetical protein
MRAANPWSASGVAVPVVGLAVGVGLAMSVGVAVAVAAAGVGELAAASGDGPAEGSGAEPLQAATSTTNATSHSLRAFPGAHSTATAAGRSPPAPTGPPQPRSQRVHHRRTPRPMALAPSVRICRPAGRGAGRGSTAAIT